MTTPSEPSLVQLWLHGGLDLSEQLQKEPPECPAENVSAHPTPRRDRTLVEQGVHRSLRLYNVLAGLLCVVLSALMLLTACSSGGAVASSPGAMWSRARRRPAR